MKRFFVATVGFGVLVVLAAVGGARADFVLTGSEHLEVTGYQHVGTLWDSSSADVRPGGLIRTAKVYDQARLGIWGSIDGGGSSQVSAYNSSTVEISAGFAVPSAYGSSTVNISGGHMGVLTAHDTSTVNISGGTVDSPYASQPGLSAWGTSTAAISGGRIDGLSAWESSTVNISGGTVVSPDGSAAALYADDTSTVNISGGTIRGLTVHGWPTVNISGGTISDGLTGGGAVNISGGTISDGLTPGGSAFISGGSIDRVRAVGYSAVDIAGGTISDLEVGYFSSVTFWGYNFRLWGMGWDGQQVRGTGTGLLTGEWFDGTPWMVNIFKTSSQSESHIWALPPPPTPPAWQLTTGGSYNGSWNWAWHVIPNGVDAEANFLDVTTVDSTITVDSPVTLGTINFDHAGYDYELAGPKTITLETSSGDARINVQAGDHTISAPLLLTTGLTVDTAAAAGLTVHLEDLAVVTQDLTKKGAGTWVVDGGLALRGAVDVQGGTLEVAFGKDLLALPGGELNIAAGGTLKIGGSVNRRVLGVRGAVLEATANGTSIGLFSATDGYDFQGKLEVGPYMVGLMDADKAQVYETHLGGGSLSSFNGIGLQAVDVFGTLGTHQGWLTGHGTVKGAVRFEVDGANFAAIAGDGPGQEIVLDGVVSGSSLLEWVIMTGLHRPGASAGFTGLGQGTNIGPGATVMGIDGTAGFATPNPAENAARGYDQWFAMFGQHAISGDLTMKLEAPTAGGEIHVPDPSVRYEIFKSYAPGGNPINAGWYIGWFNNVTLDPSWPNPAEWVWEFDYTDGRLGHGTAPDPGRAFYSATLMVIPEPSTLVLLSMGALVLTVSWWRRRRARTALSA